LAATGFGGATAFGADFVGFTGTLGKTSLGVDFVGGRIGFFGAADFAAAFFGAAFPGFFTALFGFFEGI
jgi:hypothetical protein